MKEMYVYYHPQGGSFFGLNYLSESFDLVSLEDAQMEQWLSGCTQTTKFHLIDAVVTVELKECPSDQGGQN